MSKLKEVKLLGMPLWMFLDSGRYGRCTLFCNCCWNFYWIYWRSDSNLEGLARRRHASDLFGSWSNVHVPPDS